MKRLPVIAHLPPESVELWAEDETRLGLMPVARRVGALKGTRPTRSGRLRYQALYVYGFCHPASERNRCLFLPKVNTELMGEALEQFARWADPEGQKVLVLLVDNAGWHVAKQLRVPANVRLFGLPSCTPELQPAEHLWPLVREALANQDFEHLVGLAAKLRRRCDWLASHPEAVQSSVGFHWAVKLPHSSVLARSLKNLLQAVGHGIHTHPFIPSHSDGAYRPFRQQGVACCKGRSSPHLRRGEWRRNAPRSSSSGCGHSTTVRGGGR